MTERSLLPIKKIEREIGKILELLKNFKAR